MTASFVALLPVFCMIALGAALYRAGFPGPAFWQPLDRLTYFVLFPALLVRSLADARLGGDVAPLLVATLWGAILLMAMLLLAGRRLAADGPAFTSVAQGALRFNTFVGLGVVAAFHGADGVALFAVAVAFCVPLLNLVCVLILARYATPQALDWRAQLGFLARNPLILACLAGLAINVSGLPTPGVVLATLDLLGAAALPLGLVAVGAGLDWRRTAAQPGAVLTAATLRLVAMPALVAGLGHLMGLPPAALAVAVVWGALPTASSAYILARQMGGDAPLMAGIVSAQTLLAFITLPLVVAVLG